MKIYLRVYLQFTKKQPTNYRYITADKQAIVLIDHTYRSYDNIAHSIQHHHIQSSAFCIHYNSVQRYILIDTPLQINFQLFYNKQDNMPR